MRAQDRNASKRNIECATLFFCLTIALKIVIVYTFFYCAYFGSKMANKKSQYIDNAFAEMQSCF